VSVDGWVLALGIMPTNSPSIIEEDAVAVKVRFRFPTVHSSSCLTSVLWYLHSIPFENEKRDMIVIYMLYLGCVNHLPKATEKGARISPEAVTFLLIKWNNRAIFSRLNSKDTLN